ncbi:MAG: leucine dehydrogenase, partial [Nitrospira sp.]|nr:leucine dehydrogenase [Nitrospira sp.]
HLSKAMTYKAAVADLPLGGGKAVVIGDSAKDKTEALLVALGRCVESLNGKYLIAEDVGMTLQDMESIHRGTSHVAGRAREKGGSGDPSIMTALGVLEGMKVCLEEVFGDPFLKDRVVAIQGVGKVGTHLAQLLHGEGARLYLSDLDSERLRKIAGSLKATITLPEEIYSIPCDLFAPCALGGVINEQTLQLLRCRIIAGAANNQLADKQYGSRLYERDILYAPDYVINAGGLINIACEFGGYSPDRALARVRGIADTLRKVFTLSKREGIPPYQASDRMAQDRLKLS